MAHYAPKKQRSCAAASRDAWIKRNAVGYIADANSARNAANIKVTTSDRTCGIAVGYAAAAANTSRNATDIFSAFNCSCGVTVGYATFSNKARHTTNMPKVATYIARNITVTYATPNNNACHAADMAVDSNIRACNANVGYCSVLYVAEESGWHKVSVVYIESAYLCHALFKMLVSVKIDVIQSRHVVVKPRRAGVLFNGTLLQEQ